MKNPSLNDVCINLTRYFQLKRHMNLHEQRIKNAQPTLRASRFQTNRPSGFIKKQPLAQFNRIMTIDIENKALLKKLTDKSPSRIGKQKPYKIIKNNRHKNLQEYKKQLQNEGLLKRIKQAKSSYQNNKFASERKITQNYINTISKFGYKNLTPNKTIMLPFYKGSEAREEKDLSRVSKKLSKSQSKINVRNEQQRGKSIEIDRIIKIQKKQREEGQQLADVTYVEWNNKVTIQINMENQDCACLQISKNAFEQQFSSSLSMLHNCIKYDKDSNFFYLNRPERNTVAVKKQ